MEKHIFEVRKRILALKILKKNHRVWKIFLRCTLTLKFLKKFIVIYSKKIHFCEFFQNFWSLYSLSNFKDVFFRSMKIYTYFGFPYRLRLPEEKANDVFPHSTPRPRIQPGLKLTDWPLVGVRWPLAKSAFSNMWRSEHIKPTRRARIPLPDRIHFHLEISSATKDPWVKKGPAVVRAQIHPRPIGDQTGC